MNPPPGLDGWVELFPGTLTVRHLNSPATVFVDVSRVSPLRVRAGGVQLEARMHGYLHCWLRIADDRWLA